MSNPWVRELGAVVDIDGVRVSVGVDYNAVTIAGHKLTCGLAEEFARLFTAACWQAAAQGDDRDDIPTAGYGPDGRHSREQWEAFPGEHYHFTGCGCVQGGPDE